MMNFLFGVLTGVLLGVTIMCLMQVNRTADAGEIADAADFEKSAAAGVDNTTKKA